jgi:BMFP domain-containing protein YqiC
VIVPRGTSRTVTAGSAATLVPIRVTNVGTLPVVPEGPARSALRAVVADEVGRETALPKILVPGQSVAVALPVPVPERPGSYSVFFEVVGSCSRAGTRDQITGMLLTVAETREEAAAQCCTPMLEAAQAAMAAADELRRLPTVYDDVTTGRFASWKRWLKQKLLGNFKRAYVDVLSRQQSAFNEQTLTALRELAECCATLDSVARTPEEESWREVHEQLHQTQQRCHELEARVHRLEEALAAKAPDHGRP